MNDAMRCSECGETAEKVNDIEFVVEMEDKDVMITNLTGYRCAKCGVEYHSADTVEKVQRILKTVKRTPTVRFSRKLTRSGKRWVLGIPTELMDALGLKGGEVSRIHISGRKIVAEFPEE